MFGNIVLGGIRRQQIDRSLRFRAGASAYLSRTPGGAGNQQRWTWAGWVKRCDFATVTQLLFSSYSSDPTSFSIYFSNNTVVVGSYTTTVRQTTQVLRDPSAWYHLCVVLDTPNATADDRCIIYINGVRNTAWTTNATITQNASYAVNATYLHTIGRGGGIAYYTDGYLSDVYFIDGQALTPASFGESDQNGTWVPRKYGGTYGTNGFYLPFNDPTTTATLCQDRSGNGNNWTPTNISVTAGGTYDSMVDTPTNNYATLNPLAVGAVGTAGFPEANLSIYGNNTLRGVSTFEIPPAGQWFFEIRDISYGTSGTAYVGVGTTVSQLSTAYCIYQTDGTRNITGSSVAYGATWGAAGANSDVIGVAVDNVAGTVTFYKNNVSQGVITHGLGNTLYAIVGKTGVNAGIVYINFGQRPFAYTPPTGFRALCTQNLPSALIPNPKKHFDAYLYTGDSTNNRTLTVAQFDPDLAWFKGRGGAWNNALNDRVRGNDKLLSSNLTNAESALTGYMSFGSPGSNQVTISYNGSGGNTNEYNFNSTYVAWLWKANGAGVTNNRGSIVSTVSANPLAGFSIVTYTGTGANATVGHGLGTVPKMVIVKGRATNAGPGINWLTWHQAIAATEALTLNTTNAKTTDATFWNSAVPTSSVISLGTNGNANYSGTPYVAYVFSEVPGFSRFGSYTGNGSTDGPFVYCGFRPRYVMVKRTDFADHWLVLDMARSTYNTMNDLILANSANAETTGGVVNTDYLSNGFKLRTTSTANNANGGTYIFAAFAEAPFGGYNISPANAR